MNANVRPRARAAAILLVLFASSFFPGRAPVLFGAQAIPAPDLDRALRANDLRTARSLIPGDWAAAEQLFVSYLERAFITPDATRSEPDARTLAGRLADVLRLITEYDFHAQVVLALEGADPAGRQALMAVVRDHVAALEHLRSAYKSTGPGSAMTFERGQLLPEFTGIADRYRALAFPRGEWQALRNATNLEASSGPTATRARQIAASLADDAYVARHEPYTEASLAAAERLGLPKLQGQVLESLATRAAPSGSQPASPEKLEQAAKYLEQARALARTVPAPETMNGWTLRLAAPRLVVMVLPALWSDYHQLQRPAQAQQILDEALDVSRPFGEGTVFYTLSLFAGRAGRLGVKSDVAEQSILRASQSYGAKDELVALRGIAGSPGSTFRPDLAEKALALAIAAPDPHQRAVTLEWYSRVRMGATAAAVQPPGSLDPFPALYDELLRLCLNSDEVGLTVDALVNQALFQVAAGNMAPAAATFTEAIRHAERAGDFTKVAQVANRAAVANRMTNPPASFRVEFAGRAIDAARKADDPLELGKALRARALMGVGASNDSFRDLQLALAAFERYATKSGDHTEELACLRTLAAEHVMRGEYQVAVDVLTRTAEKERAFGRPPANAVSIYQEMSRIYSTYLGEPSLALEAAERVRQLVEPNTVETEGSAPTNRDEMARAYDSLAALYRNLGQPVAALDAYGKARSIWKELAAPAERATLSNRARYLAVLGDYESSLRDWDDVLTLLAPTVRNYGGDLVSQKGKWLSDVARVHALSGDLDQALVRAREAIAELGRQTSDRWVGQPTIAALVGILLETGHPDEALAFGNGYYGKMLEMPIAQPVLERAFLEMSARVHARMGHTDKARSLLLSAVVIDKAHPTAEAGGLAGSLLALGNLEIEAGNFAKASEDFVEARTAVNPYDADRIWQIERALGLALARTGNSAAAETHYENALTALESVRERLRPEEFRLRYGFDRSQVYDDYAGLVTANAALSGRQADAEKAFQAVERKRTQTLWGLLATGWSRMGSGAVPDQVRRAMDMEARLAAKQGLLREQFDQPPDKRDAVLIERLRTELMQVQADHARLLTSIAQGQYRYAAPTTLAASLGAPVRAALGPSRVLVEHLVMDDRSYAFVVSQAGVNVVPLAVGRARLRQQVQDLLRPFRQLRTGEVDLARLTYDTREAYALYRAIFAPVQSALGSASELLIVPDDVLTVLPFDALVERMPRSVARGTVLHGEFADEAFLIRRYAIGYLTSSAQLLSGVGEPAPSPAPKRLFAMANPTAGQRPPRRRTIR
jgi:tetratricopeptide (TPR) repeat protein